ncbi:hypothetical protein L596_027862 [Steinernema carpocapsae]|uniref:Trafficking protein particle complex subunit 5 n=1 Tax=Steinernema carpocapsae TaxID=34508 RepID=A0A4U5LWR2_STECR|nr:hypothetical protein L596_027862 [Steinernema carpocapsae]
MLKVFRPHKTKKPQNILEHDPSDGSTQINISTFALLFCEIVRHTRSRVNSTEEHHEKLAEYGKFVGDRLLDVIVLREKGYKRPTKLLDTLLFVKGPVWLNLFGKEAEKLERSKEDECTYFLIEKEPLVNSFTSQGRHCSDLNPAAFSAGIVESVLTALNFPCRVTAHWHCGTAYVIKFEPEVIERMKMSYHTS